MHICLASLSVFASAYSQSDFFGKLIFLALFFLSAVCWIVLLYKVRMMRKVRHLSFAFQEAIKDKREHLLSLQKEHLPLVQGKDFPHPFGEIFFALKDKTVEVLNKNVFFAKKAEKEPAVFLSLADLELIESQGVTAISSQMKMIEKNLFVLSTIVTLAPFLGLLGTVWGILITFSQLHQGGSASSNSVILGGLSTALATTVLGLVIAIPALVSYNYLKNTTKKLASDMEDFLSNLLSTLELQYRKSEQ